MYIMVNIDNKLLLNPPLGNAQIDTYSTRYPYPLLHALDHISSVELGIHSQSDRFDITPSLLWPHPPSHLGGCGRGCAQV